MNYKQPLGLLLLLGFLFSLASEAQQAQSLTKKETSPVYLRVNQIGYLPEDQKVAVAFSESPVRGTFSVVEYTTGKVLWKEPLAAAPVKGWAPFSYYYLLDFTRLQQHGQYYITLSASKERSTPFRIGPEVYGRYHEDLLLFMRQQRCGYNPYLDRVCHQRDGRSMYAPVPDSTYFDVSGGWHDAGDQLKYLITSSNATARMLLAYELSPEKFEDQVDALGHPQPNGIPDVLDEAKWGLDWIHKMHPRPDYLFHQVADDRDHIGWKWPDQDPSDYGWGANSYRVVYFANGQPQGLQQYKSEATGIANLAGRSAAAMAMGYRIWQEVLQDTVYAQKCLQAARSLYALGKKQEGYQQGNSFGAPYRYTEDTWADDMEWGAAALYAATQEPVYLQEAKQYAQKAGTTSWMPLDTAAHYRYYPFVNIGHYALSQHVEGAWKDTLAAYYRAGIEHTLARGKKNPFAVGVPFIWCSNNLTVALITQILLYEKMTGDQRYHLFLLAQRDWLFGRNPWGTSMFTGIPVQGEYPQDVHTSVWYLTQQEVPGGLVDGPVYASIYRNLKGLHLSKPDEFQEVQNDFVVYHDDIGDYSTNEPTMDGTADAILIMAYFGVAGDDSQK